MHRTLLIRAAGVFLCLIGWATASFSQTSPSPSPSPTPTPTPLKIVYTGKLLGYFRVPTLQSGTARGCPTPLPSPTPTGTDSQAAEKFLALHDEKYNGAILVATGDNFAPQLEARTFDPNHKPRLDPSEVKQEEYQPPNKELYSWYADEKEPEKSRWVSIKQQPEGLVDLLARGEGTIPTDNVACFLAAAGFAAVVPGKHDFYFGADRVRMLARFMAGMTQEGYKPVQMLGANLVIKTVRVEAQAQAGKLKWPEDISVQNLKSVYPWFSDPVVVKVAGPKRDQVREELDKWFPKPGTTQAVLAAFLDQKASAAPTTGADDQEEWKRLRDAVRSLDSVYLCPAGDANEITNEACKRRGSLLKEARITLADFKLVYSFPVSARAATGGKNGHYSTFEPGKNYGLCLLTATETSSEGDIVKRCSLFSIYRPFLSAPRSKPSKDGRYVDPDPFVLLPNADPKKEVAIFGVVDPSIGEQVGVLNFSWLNQDDKLKTVVSAEDPAEALKQQLAYFDVWYQQETQRSFSGLKVLLAQMSPQRARILTARLRKFQVVVTEADQEQGTSETTLSTISIADQPAGTFVAIPLPYFGSHGKGLEGVVHFGKIEASLEGREWTLKGTPTEPVEVKEEPAEAKPKVVTSDPLWQSVKDAVSKCLPAHFEAGKSDKSSDLLKWLTLCAMRERAGADVALIQKRDFFDRLPAGTEQEDFQQKLDRLIWKGDLLTLMYVPGSALKKALDSSRKYDDEDSSFLSLADERLRGLEFLGITKVQNEFLINEVPIDDKKIYAVATTDYIAAGDTGYPELAAAALSPRRQPREFPESLEAISGLVCRRLFTDSSAANRSCLPPLDRDAYLDRSEAKVAASQPPSFGSKLRKLFPFKWPVADQKPKGTAQAVELRAQRHPLWTLSLKNFSLGFSSLNKNLTDAQVAQKFAGITTSSVTARQTRAVTVGLDTRLTRSSHQHEFFVSTGIDYKEQSTGDVAPSIVQINNRLSGDAGFIRSLRGGRSPNRLGIVFSFHAETPLQKPVATFTLGTQDRLRITQNRSLLVLPRIGMRWQNRSNYFEVGAQAGRELDALSGYSFNTAGSVVECRPSATETFVACISRLSKPAVAAITKDSAATAILESRRRAGFYWQSSLSIQFNAKVKYEFTEAADFFFNFSKDNATDTRYRDLSKHSLKFFVWPSFSIGPTLQVLLYQNKVNRDFLFQRQFGLEANVAFDLFNRREKSVQIKHKP